MVARDSEGGIMAGPQSGWDSLTAMERTIAKCVADGLTNAEVADRVYLSRHTVDFHLRQVYRKLDVHTRVALTHLMLKNGWQ
jgi:DNA-binding CsgD family transcriptional regulator